MRSLAENSQSVRQEEVEEIPPVGQLSQQLLAKRLGVNYQTVSRRDSRKDFPAWSRGKDPEQIAWRFIGEVTTSGYKQKIYEPIQEGDSTEGKSAA